MRTSAQSNRPLLKPPNAPTRTPQHKSSATDEASKQRLWHQKRNYGDDIWRKVHLELVVSQDGKEPTMTGATKKKEKLKQNFKDYDSFVVHNCHYTVFKRKSFSHKKTKTNNNGYDEKLYDRNDYTEFCGTGECNVVGSLPFLTSHVTYECICIEVKDNHNYRNNSKDKTVFQIKRICAIRKREHLRLADLKYVVTKELGRPLCNFETLMVEYKKNNVSFTRSSMIRRGEPSSVVEAYCKIAANPSGGDTFYSERLFRAQRQLAEDTRIPELTSVEKLWQDCLYHRNSMYGRLKKHWALYSFFPNMSAYCYREMSDQLKDALCDQLSDVNNKWKYVFPSQTLAMSYNHFGVYLKGLEGSNLVKQSYASTSDLEFELQQSLYYPHNWQVVTQLKGVLDESELPVGKRRNLTIHRRIENELMRNGDTAICLDNISYKLIHSTRDHQHFDKRCDTPLTLLELEDSVKELCDIGMLIDVRKTHRECAKFIPRNTLTLAIYDKQETKLLKAFQEIHLEYIHGLSSNAFTSSTMSEGLTPFVPLPCLAELNSTQLSAVLCTLLYSQVHIIGLPGTGKTQTIHAIYQCYGGDDKNVDRVAVVTHGGCMASELSKRGLHKAKTIHRLIHEREKELKQLHEEANSRIELLLGAEADTAMNSVPSSASSSSESGDEDEEKNAYDRPTRCEDVRVLILDEFSNVSDGLATKLFSRRIFPNLERVVTAYDPYQTAPIEEGRLAINMMCAIPTVTVDHLRKRFSHISFDSMDGDRTTVHSALTKLCLTKLPTDKQAGILSNKLLDNILEQGESKIPFAAVMELTQNHRFADGGSLNHNDTCLLQQTFSQLRFTKFAPQPLGTSTNGARNTNLANPLEEYVALIKRSLIMSESTRTITKDDSTRFIVSESEMEKRNNTNEAFAANHSLLFRDDPNSCYSWPLQALSESYLKPICFTPTMSIASNVLNYIQCQLGYFMASKTFYTFSSTASPITAGTTTTTTTTMRSNQLLALTNQDCHKVNNLCNALFYGNLLLTDVDFGNHFYYHQASNHSFDSTIAPAGMRLDNLRFYRGQKVMIRQNRASTQLTYDPFKEVLNTKDNECEEDTQESIALTNEKSTKKPGRSKGPRVSRVSNGDALIFLGAVDYYSGKITPKVVYDFIKFKRGLLECLMHKRCEEYESSMSTQQEIKARYANTSSELNSESFTQTVGKLLDTHRYYAPHEKLKYDFVSPRSLEFDPYLLSKNEFDACVNLEEYEETLMNEAWLPHYMKKSIEDVQEPFLLKDNVYSDETALHKLILMGRDECCLGNYAKPTSSSENVVLGENKTIILELNLTLFPLSAIEDGWCITVNIAQGKEYDIVALVMPSFSAAITRGLQSYSGDTVSRNINTCYKKFDLSHVHVAMSRPKKRFILFGDLEDLIIMASRNVDVRENRFSPLLYKLQNLYKRCKK